MQYNQPCPAAAALRRDWFLALLKTCSSNFAIQSKQSLSAEVKSLMQQRCRACGAFLVPGATFCGDCGARIEDTSARAPATATLPERPQPPARPARQTVRPGKRRGWYYVLVGIGTLLAILIMVVVVLAVLIRIQPGGAPQQPTMTGPHITRIQTGTGFDPSKSLVLGETQNFKAGQAVYVVFTVVNQDPNAQVVLKLFAGSTLEATSAPLIPDVGTNVYANEAVVQRTGEHRWEVDYNGHAEASISFNVS
jgi:ribosomal protein L40E